MKKLLLLSLVASFFVGFTSVSAMTEEELEAKLTQVVEIAGDKYSVSSVTKKEIERYLKENEVSSKDADYIAQKIDAAISILQSEGTANGKALSTSAKTKLKNLVSDIASNTSVKATVTSDALVIYNDDNTVFTEVSELVKQTGSESSTIATIASMAFVITLVGTCLVIRQVKANA